MDSGDVQRRDVPLLRQRLQFFRNAERFRSLSCTRVSMARQRPIEWAAPRNSHHLFRFRDRRWQLALLLKGGRQEPVAPRVIGIEAYGFPACRNRFRVPAHLSTNNPHTTCARAKTSDSARGIVDTPLPRPPDVHDNGVQKPASKIVYRPAYGVTSTTQRGARPPSAQSHSPFAATGRAVRPLSIK
jgi:hypothetical protein